MNSSLSRRERAQVCVDAGNAHLARNAYEPARAEFEQAITLNPMHAEAHLGLATAARNLHQWPEAEKAARAALECHPRYAAAAHYLGALLVEQDRLSEALPFLQAAAEWGPDVAQHHRDLGVTQLFLGDIDGARERLLKTIDLDVHTHEVLYTLTRMSKMGDGSADAERLLEIVRALEQRVDELPVPERCQVLFSLGKAYEDRGEYEESAKTFARANALKRANTTFDIQALEAKYQALTGVFDQSLLARLAGTGDPSNRPIFIVGMPRSGSTLLEQILSHHPEVHGGGEMYIWPSLLEGSTGANGTRYPDWAKTMNEVDCRNIGQAYLGRLPAGVQGRTRTTDKWLENFENLGLIACCLPNAKVIHCHRDPRDQLFSCWSLLFSQNQEYAYDAEELTRFYKAYSQLMEHWRKVLPPGLMLEVEYESLVAEPEAQTQRIFAHCGLEWDEQVLRFWESRRPVKSASMFQVREPIYDRSIGRWKHYADYIPNLFGPLEG